MEDKIKFDDVLEKLRSIESLLLFLVRQKQSDKFSKLRDLVIKKGSVTVKEAEDLLGVTRVHTLNLMKKLTKQLGFRLTIGNNQGLSSLIRYDKSLVIVDKRNQILKMFQKQSQVSFKEIMNHFNISLTDAKLLAEDFVEVNNEYQIEGENKNKIIFNGTINKSVNSC